MLRYRCQICGRIHYSRDGLKPGYCTICGPKSQLITDVDYKKICVKLVSIMEYGRKSFLNFAKTIKDVK